MTARGLKILSHDLPQDVYKRQVPYFAIAYIMLCLIDGVTALNTYALWCGVISVSYTHLDVYKRQAVYEMRYHAC